MTNDKQKTYEELLVKLDRALVLANKIVTHAKSQSSSETA